jgi:uncharacterized glyoxalase superfamily protein PhnB
MDPDLCLTQQSDGSNHTDATGGLEVEDVDAVHAKAIELGLPVVYPLTNEPWGVRRFFVTDPNGVVVNVMSHIGSA